MIARSTIHRVATMIAAVAAALSAVTPVNAQTGGTDNPVIIHGFGSWAYGRTSDNNYLAGRPEGDYRHTSMALSLIAPVSDKFSVHAQGESVGGEDGNVIALDYAFADYKVSDQLTLRFGQVRHPFGIYTEIFTVGTLRPFIDLPQSFYGPVGLAGQAYNGVGLSGTTDLGRWSLAYDVYGGGYSLQEFHVPEAFYQGSDLQNVAGESETESTRDLIGTRLVFHTPVQGLSFGTSAYSGVLSEAAKNRRTVVAAQIDYRGNRWTFESEAGHADEVRDQHVTGGYVQTAYRLTSAWQVAAQYGYLETEFFASGANDSGAPSLEFHREGAGALSYWISRALTIKAEYHLVSGNRLALPDPEKFIGILNAGQLHRVTHLIQLGAQFSF